MLLKSKLSKFIIFIVSLFLGYLLFVNSVKMFLPEGKLAKHFNGDSYIDYEIELPAELKNKKIIFNENDSKNFVTVFKKDECVSNCTYTKVYTEGVISNSYSSKAKVEPVANKVFTIESAYNRKCLFWFSCLEDSDPGLRLIVKDENNSLWYIERNMLYNQSIPNDNPTEYYASFIDEDGNTTPFEIDKFFTIEDGVQYM